MTPTIFIPGVTIEDDGTLTIRADKAAEGGVKSIELIEGEPDATARIRELEIELAVKEQTIADLRDANERAVKIATEAANRQTEELRAQLAEANETEKALVEQIGIMTRNNIGGHAINKRLRAALERYPEWENTSEYIWECRACGMRYKEYVTKRSEWKHMPTCARQAALDTAGKEGE